MSDLPQLSMRHDLVEIGSPRLLGTQFRLRTAVRSDASELAEVLSLGFDPWDEERVFRELLDDPNVPETYVVELDSRVVGTASYQLKPDLDADAGWVHYVGVHPDARGNGLGEVLTHKVLEQCVARNRKRAFLTTDDFRLPAIRIYLKLGFAPVCWHSSHQDRWEKISQQLSEGA